MDENFQDKHFEISYGPVTLTASQSLPNIAVPIDKDSDFFWEAVEVQYQGNGGNPGLPFAVKFTDSSFYELSDGMIGSFAFAAATGLGVPYVLAGPIFFPAGSAILLNLLNQINAENGPLQFIFSGRKRFYGKGN